GGPRDDRYLPPAGRVGRGHVAPPGTVRPEPGGREPAGEPARRLRSAGAARAAPAGRPRRRPRPPARGGAGAARRLRLGRSQRRHRAHPHRSRDAALHGAARRRTMSRLVALVAVALLVSGAPPDTHGARAPPDLPFRHETGRTVTLRGYVRDAPVLLVPAYYECPMLCTLVLNGVVSALRALPFDIGREFQVVTVSFNPHETSELAAAKKTTYLEQYRRPGAADGWHFLVGDETSIRPLMEAIGFRYAWDATANQYAHASGLVVLTP